MQYNEHVPYLLKCQIECTSALTKGFSCSCGIVQYEMFKGTQNARCTKSMAKIHISTNLSLVLMSRSFPVYRSDHFSSTLWEKMWEIPDKTIELLLLCAKTGRSLRSRLIILLRGGIMTNERDVKFGSMKLLLSVLTAAASSQLPHTPSAPTPFGLTSQTISLRSVPAF